MIWFSHLSTKKVSHVNHTYYLCKAYNCHIYVSFQVQTVHSNVNSHLDNNGSNDNGPLIGISDQLIIWFMQEVNCSFSWFFLMKMNSLKERERERNSAITHLYWVKFGSPALTMKILGNCISLSLISYNTSSLLTKSLHVIH